MDFGIMHTCRDHEARIAVLERRVAELEIIEEQYLSMCHAARATANSWIDTLAEDGDPDMATGPVASVAVAS